jgi:hypothetical protein
MYNKKVIFKILTIYPVLVLLFLIANKYTSLFLIPYFIILWLLEKYFIFKDMKKEEIKSYDPVRYIMAIVILLYALFYLFLN